METFAYATYLQHLIVTLAIILLFRVVWVLVRIRHTAEACKVPRKKPAKLMVVLGSGGHTFEMLKLVENISTTSYSPRVYVTATTDPMSADKAKQLEMWRVASSSQVLLLRFLSSKKDASDGPEAEEPSDYVVERIPRSRELHQSWLTTVPTTVYAILASAPILLRHSPDVILCNGPGTCVPIVLMSFLLAVLGTKKTMVVFVESFCRVETLSISGRILYHLADHFVVQWPQLTTKYPRARYHGLLI
ncbi:UDP-N-acetylglucosamine transferase subunit ALG14 [Dermacentor albipictus]|uniref:UDP-N-acetylglucosamine transferase subunit ALG14 n=1 Tax=Dermacentor albipictus TaxID=60249 RepID=UPI0038FC6E35